MLAHSITLITLKLMDFLYHVYKSNELNTDALPSQMIVENLLWTLHASANKTNMKNS